MTTVTERAAAIGEVLRYARPASPLEAVFEDHLNYWFLTHNPEIDQPKLLLEAGINTAAEVRGPDGIRRPVICLRSSPHKAGSDVTPWQDEFDLDHGHVRYYGDHKVTTNGPIGTTRGNKALMVAWELHGSGNRDERLIAPPVLLFRAVPRHVDGRRIDKGYLEFCGAAVIERLEFVVQRDPTSGRTFPNIAVDLDVVALDSDDCLDFRWIDDRRDEALAAEQTLRHAPSSWARWIDEGRAALPRIRRRVMSSRVRSRKDQLPEPGTREARILQQVYQNFNDDKHAFEWLAARVAEHVMGAGYNDGWLTRAGGDGGMDFVGRLDVGPAGSRTPLVVLGQAKCVLPDSSVSPDQVARLVARLRRGWVGVFVTTGHFSQQAQIEMVDDEYPVVLVNGRVLAETVYRLAEESYEGDVTRLLRTARERYPESIAHRRPSEVLTGLA